MRLLPFHQVGLSLHPGALLMFAFNCGSQHCNPGWRLPGVVMGRVGGIFLRCWETVPSKEKRKEERKEIKRGRERERD